MGREVEGWRSFIRPLRGFWESPELILQSLADRASRGDKDLRGLGVRFKGSGYPSSL